MHTDLRSLETINRITYYTAFSEKCFNAKKKTYKDHPKVASFSTDGADGGKACQAQNVLDHSDVFERCAMDSDIEVGVQVLLE